MNEKEKTMENESPRQKPAYTLCHPNAKGTGCAVRIELNPAHDYVDGSIVMTFMEQKTIGSIQYGRRIMPTFASDNRISVRLSLNEIAQILEVLRGYREKVADGNGFFHKTPDASTIITFEHRLEPVPGYVLSVSRKTLDGNTKRMWIHLSLPEALTLSEAISGSMMYLAFGIPTNLIH